MSSDSRASFPDGTTLTSYPSTVTSSPNAIIPPNPNAVAHTISAATPSSPTSLTTIGTAMATASMDESCLSDRGSLYAVVSERSTSPPCSSPCTDEKEFCEADFDQPGLNRERSSDKDDDEGEPFYLSLLPPRTDPLEHMAPELTSSGEQNPYDNDDLFDPRFLERMKKIYRLKRLRKKLEKQSALDNDCTEQSRPQTKWRVSPMRQHSAPYYTSLGERASRKLTVNPSESDLDFLMKHRVVSPLPDYKTGRNPKDPLPRIRDHQVPTDKLLTKANTLMSMPYTSSASDSDNSTDYEEIVDFQPGKQSLGEMNREKLERLPARLIQTLGLSPNMRLRTKKVGKFVKRRTKLKDFAQNTQYTSEAASSDSNEPSWRNKRGTEPTSYGNSEDMANTQEDRLPKTNGDSCKETDVSYLQKLQTFEEILELCGTVKTHLQTQTSEHGKDAGNKAKFSPGSSPTHPPITHSPVLERNSKLSSPSEHSRMVRTPSPSHSPTIHGSNNDGGRTCATLPRHMRKLLLHNTSIDSARAANIKKEKLRRIRTVLLNS